MPAPSSVLAMFCAAAVSLISIAGCVVESSDDLGPVDSDLVEPATQPRASGSLFDTMCPNDVQIARVQPTNGCPPIAGWQKASVLTQGNPWLLANPSPTFVPQGHLCRYSWSGVGNLGAALNVLTSHNQVIHTGPDCQAVQVQGTSVITDAVEGFMRDQFRAQTGRVDSNALLLADGSSSEPGRSPVVVGVIDTMPNGPTPDPRSEHGENMAHFIADIACPSGEAGCAVVIERTLGMPRYPGGNGVDWDRGGFMATHADLAAAIMQQVKHWRQTASATTPRIINLSVGWEPGTFGGNEITPPPRIAAVLTALEIAACEGALIIASAGNETALCGTGAMLPGGWEQRAAPTDARCQQLGITGTPTTGSYRPLVHAVGGLDTANGPMPGTRTAGTPRLATAATYGVAGEGNLTTGLTGTSVSAAVVSGAAALVWSYAPELSAHEVMDVLYATAEPTGRDAEFNLPTSPGDVRELDVCAALQLACEQSASCPTLSLGCVTGPVNVDLTTAVALVNDVEVDTTVKPSFGKMKACAPTCGVATSATGTTPFPCFATKIPPSAYYVAPQPNSPACSHCTITGSTVRASLDSYYEGQTIDDVVITIFDGVEYSRFDFGPVGLTPQEVTQLRLPSTEVPATVVSATMGVTFAGHDYPVDNELLWQ